MDRLAFLGSILCVFAACRGAVDTGGSAGGGASGSSSSASSSSGMTGCRTADDCTSEVTIQLSCLVSDPCVADPTPCFALEPHPCSADSECTDVGTGTWVCTPCRQGY